VVLETHHFCLRHTIYRQTGKDKCWTKAALVFATQRLPIVTRHEQTLVKAAIGNRINANKISWGVLIDLRIDTNGLFFAELN